MANALEIKKYADGYFRHTLNGDTSNSVIDDNPHVTSFGNYFHFKTANGAPIFAQQNILFSEVTYIDVTNVSFTFASIDSLWIKLLSEEYVRLSGGGGVGATRFDDLIDTFDYPLNDGKVPVVDASNLKLIPVDFFNKRFFTELDDVSVPLLLENKMVTTAIVGGDVKLVLSDLPSEPEVFANTAGYFRYNDLATQTTPLNFSTGVYLKITNDALGTGTDTTQRPYGITTIYDSSTNSFDLSQLSIGDQVDFNLSGIVTTTGVNQVVRVEMRVAVGSPSAFTDTIFALQVKTAAANQRVVNYLLTIDNDDIRNYPTEIWFISDGNGTLKVNGFLNRIIRKGVNIVQIQADNTKLDKVSTAGVERAYIINADGSQGTKATSEFKDVLEFADLASFPATGETGKIYLALDTNFTYRWSGSLYVQIGGGKRYQTFLFQSSATVVLSADQKNFHQSRFNAGSSVFSTLGLTMGNGIPEPAGVLNLSYLSDTGVPNITPNYVSKVVNVTLSYSRNVAESGANTNVKIRLISDTKYNTDIQKICEHVITSNTLLVNAEGRVSIPILTHLPLRANSNLKWTIRSNNGVAQQFNILRLNVDIEEI